METTPRSNLSKTGFGFVAAIAAAVGMGTAINQGLRKGDASIDRALVQVASELNKSLPMTVDAETRLDNVGPGAGKNFSYRYTLVKRARADMDPEALNRSMKPMLVNQYRTNKDLEFFRKSGITMHYQYSDKDGVFLTEVVVGPDDMK